MVAGNADRFRGVEVDAQNFDDRLQLTLRFRIKPDGVSEAAPFFLQIGLLALCGIFQGTESASILVLAVRKR